MARLPDTPGTIAARRALAQAAERYARAVIDHPDDDTAGDFLLRDMDEARQAYTRAWEGEPEATTRARAPGPYAYAYMDFRPKPR